MFAFFKVSYKNKPLIDHANALTLDRTKPTAPSLHCNLKNSDAQVSIENKIPRNHTRQDLINTTLSLKTLLSNCRVSGVSKEEVLFSDQLPKDFWDNDEVELSNDDISKALDFWRFGLHWNFCICDLVFLYKCSKGKRLNSAFEGLLASLYKYFTSCNIFWPG